MMRKKNLQEKGITLIALVVTIVILLILVGVTLNMALSQNGLFSKTKEATEKYKQTQRDEEDMITEIDKQFRPVITTLTDYAIDNVDAKDSLGNLITIPKGFKIIEGSTVKEGIVIQDSEGNEFVWIPVSNIDGDNNAKTNPEATDLIAVDDSNKVEITLGRYTFNTLDGNPTLVQKGSEYSNNDEKFVISEYYRENTNDERVKECKSAKNLQEFVDSVKKNHGYYIARYEVGKNNGDDSKPVSKSGIEVWTGVTQSEASDAAKKMYGDTKYSSDLVNSYAWDTAVVYIQSMIDDNYANQEGNRSEKGATGDGKDERCKINDMAGNVREWTTEYSTGRRDEGIYPFVMRGGFNGSGEQKYVTVSRNYRK